MEDIMKKYSHLICLALLVFSATQVEAGSALLEKGFDVFNAVKGSGQSAQPSNSEIGNAFKEALRIGSDNVVAKLGVANGFNADPAVHIPLPDELNTVKTVLSKLGMSGMLDDLELKLNRAAEAATPKAKNLFRKAISGMTFTDVKGIYQGPEDSATKYFQQKMSPDLGREMQPIVQESLSRVGAVQAFDNVMAKYKALPFVPDVKADLTDHVVSRGMDGIFHYMAQEEAAIRKDPLKQTTALLKKVFGAR
jgi:hypothetical protein